MTPMINLLTSKVWVDLKKVAFILSAYEVVVVVDFVLTVECCLVGCALW